MDTAVALKPEITIHFDAAWCMNFLDITEDANRSFHTKVVQGVAIIAKVDKIISEVMTGYGVAEILGVQFIKQIRIGDTVAVEINKTKREGCKTIVEVSLLSKEVIFVTGKFIIVPIKLLERAARSQS